jgi:hypothetical protein
VLPKSLDPDTLRTVALGAVGGTALLVLLVVRLVQRMVVKVVLVGALVGAGVYVWSQRVQLQDCVPKCACTFVGFDVKVDAPVCDTGSTRPPS